MEAIQGSHQKINKYAKYNVKISMIMNAQTLTFTVKDTSLAIKHLEKLKYHIQYRSYDVAITKTFLNIPSYSAVG